MTPGYLGRSVTCTCGATKEGQVTWHALANSAPHDDYCSKISRSFTAERLGYDGLRFSAKLDNRGNEIA